MFKHLFFLIALGVIGQSAVAQRNVSQDITEQIQHSELEYAKQIVVDCLADKSAGKISEYQAYSSLRGQSLYIIYAWHEDGSGRKTQYTAQFWRELPELDWQLAEITFMGEQILSGQNAPVHFSGYLKPETVKEVIARATDLWRTGTTDPFEIAGIMSNQMPPMYCQTARTEIKISEIIYEVAIRNLAPRKRPPPKAAPNSLTVGSFSSNDNTYSIRLIRDSREPPVTKEVNCLGGGVCDPDLLSQLRDNLDRPVDPAELEDRLLAAFAVLPVEYRDAKVKETQLATMGSLEHFHVQLEEVAVSPARIESSSVSCARIAGSSEDWHCQYKNMSARQIVSGQSSPVSLMMLETLSEADVEAIVIALRKQLAEHPDIASTDGDFRFTSIHESNEGYQCSIIHGQAFFNVIFTYNDDEVRLKSVELQHQWNADGTVKEF